MALTKLRFAALQDAGRLTAVLAPYTRDSVAVWAAEVPTRAQLVQHMEALGRAGLPVLVAEDPSGLLGFAFAEPFTVRRGALWSAQVQAYLAPDERRRGIGSALVNAVCDLLSAQGYCACYACVSHPHPESEAFFAALGFAEQARLPAAGFKLGLWLDLSICERPLRARTARPAPPMAVGALDGAYVRGVFARRAKDIR